MDIYKLNVDSIKDLSTQRKYYHEAATELDTIIENLYMNFDIDFQESKEKKEYLKQLLYRLRIKGYELEEPVMTDGSIDLYRDHLSHFTICLHDKVIPIGDIEYTDTHRAIPGNISYEIFEKYRGHHYALRALRLVGQKLLELGVKKIYVTASNNENIPSIKTIENFGGVLYHNMTKAEEGPIPYICDLERIYSK